MKKYINLISVIIFIFAFSSIAFAEDDVSCTGEITGSSLDSLSSYNSNIKHISFDDRGKYIDGHYTGYLQDLSVIGLGSGYVPPREYAACSEESSASGTYDLKGYAWNDNGGFVSMYCGSDGKNLGINCGAYEYGVSITPDALGRGTLDGYAWSETFGWINFSCLSGVDGLGNACGAIDYFVERQADGTLTGHAYTEAGIYLIFDGVYMGLPGEEAVNDSWCDGKAFVCVELTPDPDEASFELEPGEDGAYLLADGQEGYELHLYLRNENGVSPMDPLLYNVDNVFATLEFDWIDTVKVDQSAGNSVGTTLNTEKMPIKTSNGAVVYKPISSLTKSDFTQPDPVGEPDHWVLKNKIASIAPTTNANISKTSSLNSPILFENDVFLFDYDFITDAGGIEQNDLKLNSISYELLSVATGLPVPDVASVIHANGVISLPLKFRPVIELETLYVNDMQDKIDGYRGIPVTFKLKSVFHHEGYANALVDLILAYDRSKTVVNCGGVEDQNNTFSFHFLRDLEGNSVEPVCTSCVDSKETAPECTECKEMSSPVSSLTSQKASVLLSEKDLPAIATVPEGEAPCSMVAGPGLSSMIYYVDPTFSKNVVYYSNKIPRIAGSTLANPVAVVHGNVYVQTSFAPSNEVEALESTPSINLNVVRDTVDKNLKTQLNKFEDLKGGTDSSLCVYYNDKNVTGCTEGLEYVNFEVDGEKITYFKNADVDLIADNWTGARSIVVSGANVHVKGDVYNADSSDKYFSIVVLRNHDQDYGEAGNMYIAPDVQNIQANIVTDGSIFSYEPGNGYDQTTGLPNWSSTEERMSSLSNQLLFEGSLSSRNTVGGADLDSPISADIEEAKNYVLLGTGEVIEGPVTAEERLLAQEYDLNYLRMYRMHIQITADGLPVDQQCGKGLTLDDIIEIENGGTVSFGSEICDGIDPLRAKTSGGDLVPPEGLNHAKGLAEDDYSPVYIYYVAPQQNSFIFAKEGSLEL